MKRPSVYEAIIGAIVALVVGYIVLYGDDRWFSREKGEAMEKQQIKVEAKIDSNHQVQMIEQRHIREDVSEIKGIVKEAFMEISRRPGD